jgi:DNA-binding winged helix-turn-helix (wHTH) protein/predicted ATPase
MARSWSFPPFRLDLDTGSVWREDELVPLPPKPFAVLAALVAHAGQVVTKEALFEAAWPDTAVTDGVLKGCIRQIRHALGERAGTASYIITVHRRGYRFCVPVTPIEGTVSGAVPDGRFAAIGALAPSPVMAASPSGLVGREAELAQLQRWWAQACQGRRQVVFITGEAGIGKTTLVDAFVAQMAATAAVWSARGQCIEHYGAGEAYLPLLEALGQLGRGPDGAHLVALLHQSAPTWLVHLPALVPAADDEAVQRRAGGATRERMMRELAEAVEGLTAQRPVVLVLEDLHWSDAATLDWLASVARRREAARLLVLGTYRPAEAVVQAHPVRRVTQELLLHGQGVELPLGLLAEPEVAAYLTQRFGAGARPESLARGLHQRTEGNPLFLATVVDELVRRGVVRQEPAGWELVGGVEAAMVGVPESLRLLIDRQLAQLPLDEQQILEAASVVGVEFTAAAVAAGVEQAMERVEEWCTTWARQGQFVQTRGVVEWPDGTVTAGYGFRHALYREILYERVPISRRMRWHRQIGRRLEAGYGPRAREVAAELAEHFVHGRDTVRAAPYLQMAGVQAIQRSAHQEALRHLTRSLELLAALPETPERAQQELDLLIALGPVLIATKSQAAPEVEQTYARALALCQQVGEPPQLFPALQGLCEYYRNRGALPTARALGEQLSRLAQRAAEPMLRLEAHVALGTTLFHLGDYTTAWTHLKQGIAVAEPTAQRTLALRQGVAPGVRGLALAANTLWCLGAPTQAVRRSQEALALAEALTHPYSLALAQHFAAFLHHRRRDVPAVQAQAEALLTLATGQGFPLYVGYGTCYRGWALAMQGQGEAGLAQMRQGLATLLATGLELSRPLWLGLLAEVTGHVGQVDEGLRLLAEALVAFEASERGDMRAEACRLQGELRLRQVFPDVAQAEACFQQALTLARRQQAKSWELRAAMSLSRLWQQQGKRAAAYELLAPIYSWFTEGFDTADLQEAKMLLEKLVG